VQVTCSHVTVNGVLFKAAAQHLFSFFFVLLDALKFNDSTETRCSESGKFSISCVQAKCDFSLHVFCLPV
jgi:hypothetical protein